MREYSTGAVNFTGFDKSPTLINSDCVGRGSQGEAARVTTLDAFGFSQRPQVMRYAPPMEFRINEVQAQMLIVSNRDHADYTPLPFRNENHIAASYSLSQRTWGQLAAHHRHALVCIFVKGKLFEQAKHKAGDFTGIIRCRSPYVIPSASSPRLLKFDNHLIDRQTVSSRCIDCRNNAGFFGLQHIFHLHGFDHGKGLAGLYHITDFNIN